MNWQAPYFDRRTWLLDHLETLHLDAKEALVLLLIDFYNQTNQMITHELLSEKVKVSVDEIESIFITLNEKDYLSIDFQDGNLIFSLEGLFHEGPTQNEKMHKSLVEQFEDEFKRPLSPNEMQSILDMEEAYDGRRVVCALNEAVVAEKYSINYIEHILASWARKGLSIEDLENGIR